MRFLDTFLSVEKNNWMSTLFHLCLRQFKIIDLFGEIILFLIKIIENIVYSIDCPSLQSKYHCIIYLTLKVWGGQKKTKGGEKKKKRELEPEPLKTQTSEDWITKNNCEWNKDKIKSVAVSVSSATDIYHSSCHSKARKIKDPWESKTRYWSELCKL